MINDVLFIVSCRYGVASTYYGISLNISGLGLNIYLTHFIYAAIEVPAKLMLYCCLNIVGRRKCQAGTLLLTGLCIAINIFLPQGDRNTSFSVTAIQNWNSLPTQIKVIHTVHIPPVQLT